LLVELTTSWQYRPAQHFDERASGDPIAVTFTMKDGQKVRRSFRPDSADWFEVRPYSAAQVYSRGPTRECRLRD
jgi:hypothetical protein